MMRYDPGLIEKLSKRLGKTPKYIREQISKKAFNDDISPEAELAKWARSHGISAESYIRKLAPNIQSQIYAHPSNNNNGSSKSSVFRIIQLGKKKDEWYNLWWVQLLIAFFVVGILANIISQILGTYFIYKLGLTKP